MTQQTLIFTGPQGSGKGTQIELLEAYLRRTDPERALVHFEMGKSLRALAAQESYTATLVRGTLAQGNLVPYVISCSVFAQHLMAHMGGNEHLVIDGFPRTADQVPALHSAVEFYGRKDPAVVCINISDEEAVRRLRLRGRADDSDEQIRTRLEWSRKETMPNVEWFRAHPEYHVVDINGEQSVEDVHKDILAALSI